MKNLNWNKLAYGLIAIILFIMIYVFSGASFLKPITDSLSEGVLDIFVNGDVSRTTGMRYAVEVIKQYPLLGCGWNLLTSIFQDNGYYGVNGVLGSYSAGLSLAAEIGIGSVFYYYFVIKSSVMFIRKKDDTVELASGITLLLYFALFFATDYSIDGGSAVFLGLMLSKLLKDYYSLSNENNFES